LYTATKDQQYLKFGKDFLNVLEHRSRASCGYASVANVETGRLDDRMDSYFLTETLKYLYLLFDEVRRQPSSLHIIIITIIIAMKIICFKLETFFFQRFNIKLGNK